MENTRDRAQSEAGRSRKEVAQDGVKDDNRVSNVYPSPSELTPAEYVALLDEAENVLAGRASQETRLRLAAALNHDPGKELDELLQDWYETGDGPIAHLLERSLAKGQAD